MRKILIFLSVVLSFMVLTGTGMAEAQVPFLNAPFADAGGPYEITEGDDLFLDGTLSTDADMPFGDSITNYRWSFENISPAIFFASGPAITLRYSQIESAIENYYKRQVTPEIPYSFVLWVSDTTQRWDYDWTSLTIHRQSQAIPEPATLMLFGSGLFGFIMRRKRA